MVNGSINQPFSTNSSMPWCGGVSSMATNRFVDCSSDNMNRQISGQIEKCNNSSLQQRSPTSSSILTADVAAASASHRMGNVKRNNSVKEAASAKELKEMNIQYDMVEHPTLHNAKESASDKQHEYVGMNDNYEQSISKTVRELKEMDLRDQDEVPQTVYNYKYQGDMQMGQERHKHILNPSVRSALIKNPKYRSIKDKFIIADYMKLLDPIKNLSISATRLISNKVTLEFRNTNEALYRKGDSFRCWYILLNGSVFTEHSIILPISRIGILSIEERNRDTNCFALEPSEFIAVNYPFINFVKVETLRASMQNKNDVTKRYIDLESYCSPDKSNYKSTLDSTDAHLRSLHSPDKNSHHHIQQQNHHSYRYNTNIVRCYTSTHEPIISPNSCNYTNVRNDSFCASPTVLFNHEANTSLSSPSPTVRRLVSSSLQTATLVNTDNSLNDSLLLNRNYNSIAQSRASDTSSAYSDSDLIPPMCSTLDETNLNAFNESVDDESQSESSEPYFCDTVKECLEKNIKDRTDDDINNIVDFIEFYPIFAKFNQSIRREISKVVVLAIVPLAGTVILCDQELYDSWTVIINGEIENLNNDGSQEYILHVGDSFGIDVHHDREYHQGVMKTLVNDCQFLCLAKSDYYQILQASEDALHVDTDDANNIILVKEIVKRPDGTLSETVIKASNEVLRKYLIDASASNEFVFVEDYLLTHRMFAEGGSINLCEFLFKQFAHADNREPIANIFLIWVRCFYWDFANNSNLRSILDQMIALLQTEGMEVSLKLLSIACTEKSKQEIIVLPRSDRSLPLGFQLDGGFSKGYSSFISWVDEQSKAYDLGLRRGHQIMEVNSVSVDHIPLNKIVSMMKDATHLCLTVKLNLTGFFELLRYPDKSPAKQPRISNGGSSLLSNNSGISSVISQSCYSHLALNALSSKRSYIKTPVADFHAKYNGRSRSKISNLKRTFLRLTSQRSSRTEECDRTSLDKCKDSIISNDDPSQSTFSNSSCLNDPASSSNKDVNSTEDLNESTNKFSNLSSFSLTSQTPLHLRSLFYEDELPLVIKIYRSDHTFRYLPVHRDTTAKQVVMLAVTAFDISAHSGLFSLCEVSVENGVAKQKKLSDRVCNLAERISLNARYYLKDNSSTESIISDEVGLELNEQLDINFANLNPLDVAAQLCLRDFTLFCSIEPSELLTHALKLDPDANTSNVVKFSKVVNDEMYWVITEIVKERSIWKRVKIIKNFVKIAKLCQEIRNFNSVFAIVSGLDHKAVTRLESTWERIPDKTKSVLSDLKAILDPSKNMLKYRRLLKTARLNPPLIPMFPLCIKDLTFIHQGNQTSVNKLVNFEKFRTVSNEIRAIIEMKNSAIDLESMAKSPAPFHFVFSAFGCTCLFEQSLPSLLERFNLISTTNSKRLYEECMMAKRAKYYLSSLDIIDDEQRLLDIANYCESYCDSPDQRSERFMFLSSKNRFKVRPSPSFYRKSNASKPVIPNSSTASPSNNSSTSLRSTRNKHQNDVPNDRDNAVVISHQACYCFDHNMRSNDNGMDADNKPCDHDHNNTSNDKAQHKSNCIYYNQYIFMKDANDQVCAPCDLDSGRASLTSSENQIDSSSIIRHRTFSSGTGLDKYNQIQDKSTLYSQHVVNSPTIRLKSSSVDCSFNDSEISKFNGGINNSDGCAKSGNNWGQCLTFSPEIGKSTVSEEMKQVKSSDRFKKTNQNSNKKSICTISKQMSANQNDNKFSSQYSAPIDVTDLFNSPRSSSTKCSKPPKTASSIRQKSAFTVHLTRHNNRTSEERSKRSN